MSATEESPKTTVEAAELQKKLVVILVYLYAPLIFILYRWGNEAFTGKRYEEAIAFYTEAIKLDPENSIYYSNRR